MREGKVKQTKKGFDSRLTNKTAAPYEQQHDEGLKKMPALQRYICQHDMRHTCAHVVSVHERVVVLMGCRGGLLQI